VSQWSLQYFLIFRSVIIICVYVARCFIGGTTQAYIVTMNSTSSYSVEISARGAGLPVNSTVSGGQQVSSNCSDSDHCELDFVSPLVDVWHYLTVNNWLHESSAVNLHVLTVGQSGNECLSLFVSMTLRINIYRSPSTASKLERQLFAVNKGHNASCKLLPFIS